MRRGTSRGTSSSCLRLDIARLLAGSRFLYRGGCTTPYHEMAQGQGVARTNRRTKTPEAALRMASDAVGEPSEVSVLLDKVKWGAEPDAGGRWLSHCLDPDRRAKLSLRQVHHIFRLACEAGEHEGFAEFARLCGYSVQAIAPEAQLAEALKAAEAARRDAEQTARDLQTLIDNPRLTAWARRTGVKLEDAE